LCARGFCPFRKQPLPLTAPCLQFYVQE
jgi:hypothetical protein